MTTTIRTITRFAASIDWRAIGTATTRAIHLAWIAVQLLLAAAVLLGDIAWEHRAEIRQALVNAIAATYVAGQWTRQQLEGLTDRSVAMLPQQPIVTLAPITATLAAARVALERLIARLYPALAI